MFKVAAPIVKNSGHSTRTFGPEHVKTYDRTYRFVNPIFTDANSHPYLDVVATHGYADDGITPGSQTASDWERMFDLAQQKNKPLWMTETGNALGWDGAMTAGKRILGALKYGQIQAWIWWSLMKVSSNVNDSDNHQLIWNGIPHGKYWTSINFFRYIRPGAVQIGSSSDDNQVGVVAFNHAALNRMTIVLVNDATGSKTVTLNGSGLPATFNVYRNSLSQENMDLAAMSSTASISLPGKSFTTLYSGEAVHTVTPRRRPNALVLRYGATARARLLMLDGRLVRGCAADAVERAMVDVAEGTYLGVITDAAGKVLESRRVIVRR
jgi:O-glycosyl hydrolase